MSDFVDETVIDSFDIHDEMLSNFWINNKLNPKIRQRLLSIATDFMSETAVDWETVNYDILVTGSIANYNYSEYSDVDLHLYVDLNEFNIDVELLKDYFTLKCKVWNESHENLNVYGYQVEIYVEAVGQNSTPTGLYSVKHDCWLVNPSKEGKDIDIDKAKIVKSAISYIKKINFLKACAQDTNDFEELESIKENLKEIFTELKNGRSEGLRTEDKEMAFGNLLWKALKRMGYTQKIWSIINYIYSKENSITESKR